MFQYNGNCISFDFGASEQYKEIVTKLLVINIRKESYMHCLVNYYKGLKYHKSSNVVLYFLKGQTIISSVLLRPCKYWQYSVFGQNREILLYYHPNVKETYTNMGPWFGAFVIQTS